MPDNKIPRPEEVFGTQTTSKIPTPDEAFSKKYIDPIDNFKQAEVIERDNDQKINSTLDFVQQNSLRTLRDDEKDILKKMIKNPYTTQDQLSDAIVTLQGKKAKQIGNSWTTPDYYMARDASTGNYVPVSLSQGEAVPEGAKVASLWGTQDSANDDSWYTDLSKSLANGIFGAIGGVVDLAQVGTTLASGEESEMLRSAKNSTEALKFKKDVDLEAPLFNTEGIKEWTDALDISRFDISPKTIWGTLNMAAESFTEFAIGAKGAGTLIKGGKGFRAGLRGLDEAVELGSAGRKAAIFTGSFMSQLGENLDNAEYAGLKGRDKAIAASLITAPMAAIDAAYGLEGKIMDAVFRKGKRELLSNVIQSIERDAVGNITEEGFRQLAAATTVGYTQLAKSGVKNILKGALTEGTQEAAQEFAKKSGEQLWDKLAPEDKAKFGTDAFSAKSFGEYVNNFAMGLISGVPLSVASSSAKARAQAQSESAFARVQEGPDSVNALRTDLQNSFERGEITEQEKEDAFFRLDKYQKYYELTNKYNLQEKDKLRAAELSFQIEGLNTEIPANNQLAELSPIERADIESKRKMQTELQKELNDIILRSDVIAEPTVAQAVQESIDKEDAEVLEVEAEKAADIKPVEEIVVPEAKPTKPKSTRRSFEETPAEEFNALDSLTRKQTVQEYLKSTVNKAIEGFIEEGQNGKLHVNIGGKYLTFAQSVRPTGEMTEENIRRENLPATMEKGKVRTLNGEVAVNPDTLEPLSSFAEPVNVQRQEIDAYDEEGNQLFNEDGSPKKKAVLNVFNGQTGKYIISIREKDKQAGRKYKASQYSKKEIEQLKALQQKGFQVDEVVQKPATKPKPKPKNQKDKEKEADELLDKGVEYNRTRREELIREGKTPEEASEITYQEFLETAEGKRYLELVGKSEEAVSEKVVETEANPVEKPETKPVETPTEKPVTKPEKQSIKKADEVKAGDRISDINGKKGTVVEVNGGKITIKYDNNATFTADPRVIELFKESNDRLQKKASFVGEIDKVVEAIQNAMPNITVELTNEGDFAGKLSEDGKTITINVNYAGFDTPIHEAGHVLIDALGYNNSIVQKAIKQLRETALYEETKARYPELSEKELDKEVLAEAIGREGASIFEEQSAKTKFETYLNYIYDWLKTKLGLNKNIAKSLAKQVISGIGTKDLKGTDTGVAQEQRNKKKLKVMTYSQYRAGKLRSFEQEEKDIASAEKVINDTNSTPEAKKKAKKTMDAIKQQRREDTKDYKKYKADAAVIQDIIDSEDLSKYTTDQLVDLFNQIKNFEFKAKEALMKDVMLRIATTLQRQGKERIMKEHLDYIESLADKKDIGRGQIWLLHGSHFSEYQPEMQEAYRIIQQAQLNKIKEANEKKALNEALASKVIAERNKILGIKEFTKNTLLSVGVGKLKFNSDSANYFEYMDNGSGQLLTIEEARTKGLSKAQIDYLDFTRKVLAERIELLSANDYQNAELDVIQVDKNFSESFKQDGLAQAFSYYLGGGGSNLGNVRIMYKGRAMYFKDIEKEIVNGTTNTTGIESIVANIKAIYELLRYNIAAKRQLKRGFNVDERQNPLELLGDAQYSLNTYGQLVSKFDKPRTQGRGYSKDFYRAMVEFIDDTTHVKHINPILPIIDSVETLNRDGYIQEGIQIKPNVAKWIAEYKKLQIFKEPNAQDPLLDTTVKLFRSLTASTTMWFNYPANLINVVMGNYNSWRQENTQTLVTGNKRLFGNKGVNKYALDIIRKYSIVNQDFDSNPKIGLGKIFDKMATIGTQIGEYHIQGTLALGLMTEEDYNSFEYETDQYGVEKLIVKKSLTPEQVKALEERIIGYKNRVTDIQGKYPEEDRRNILNSEWGKAVFQFKVWMPDYFKERFGARYINSRNEIKEGTFRQLFREGFKQIKADIAQKGMTKALWENKVFMSNLKGLASIGFLLALKYKDDDDDKKRKAATLVENTLGQLLFITDFDQLKYTLANPVAGLGKAKDAVAAIEALVKLETNSKGEYTADDKIGRLIPARKLANVYSAVTE